MRALLEDAVRDDARPQLLDGASGIGAEQMQYERVELDESEAEGDSKSEIYEHRSWRSSVR